MKHSRPLYSQGRIDTTVFEAFKALEVEMRSAAGLGGYLVGTTLAARAFHPENGPLTEVNAEKGERVVLMNHEGEARHAQSVRVNNCGHGRYFANTETDAMSVDTTSSTPREYWRRVRDSNPR